MLVIRVFHLLFLLYLSKEDIIEIGPKNYIPDLDNVRIVGAVAMDKHPEMYLTAFHPDLSDSVHHIGVYASGEPRSKKLKRGEILVFPNGTENSGISFGRYIYGNTGKTGPLVLPEEVSYLTGPNTDSKYLLYEMHYKNKKDGLPDNSKVSITYQTKRTKYTATQFSGNVPYGSFIIPKHSTSVATVIVKVPVKMWPLFFHAHTHDLGTVVTGHWVQHDSSNPEADKWTKLGSRNPQLPQIFQPTDNRGPMMPGDLFIGRCHYNNTGDEDRKIGRLHEDEMCDAIMVCAVNYGDENIWGEQVVQSPEEYGLKNTPEQA